MTHRSISLKGLTLTLSHKICFQDFDAKIHFRQRIGVIGQNGCGKSSLIQMIRRIDEPTAKIGYVPQTIVKYEALSGGQRFNQALSDALATQPNMLCLDEPTNHLDQKNRHALLGMLKRFDGTLIVATHDLELLESCVDIVWHICDGEIHVFNGTYLEYANLRNQKIDSLKKQISNLGREKKEAHSRLMREQERSKKKRVYGEKKYDGDKLALRSAQGRGERTANKNKKHLAEVKSGVLEHLSKLHVSKIIKPRFNLPADHVSSSLKTIVNVQDGSCGYEEPVLSNIDFRLHEGEKLWLTGDNGSGKTTLVRALLGDPAVWREGSWNCPGRQEVGFLDQHYGNLKPNRTALELLTEVAPKMTIQEMREHLNAFLLRKNEEVTLPSVNLSGGEKARLSLALIAASVPKVLILDEVTNNVDLETREHLIQILQEYPGTLMLISHDVKFAKAIGVLECKIGKVKAG